MYELHQDRLQVATGSSGLHTETQLLLKVPTKRHLGKERDSLENYKKKLKIEKVIE